MIVAGLDTESTGLVDPAHRLIEVCVQKWQVDDWNAPALLETKTWRIHPERSIDPKAQAVHNITLDDLAGAPKLEEILPEIMNFLLGVDLIVAHNGDEFDRPFIRLEIQRVAPTTLSWLTQLDQQRWFDTMQEGRWSTAWGKVPNLSELCWATDVVYDPTKAHAAEYDVTVMMKAFFFGVQKGFFNPFPGVPAAA